MDNHLPHILKGPEQLNPTKYRKVFKAAKSNLVYTSKFAANSSLDADQSYF